MPCYHKFSDYLNLETLDFEPTTLIVGTFNPEWPIGNNATWFYGRTGNNYFWDVLPRIYNQPSLINNNEITWKSFCRNNNIAITDIISCIGDADEPLENHQTLLENYSDKNIAQFNNHAFTDIIQLLLNHPTIDNVYLTRGVGEKFWRNIWQPVKNYCNQNNITCKELLTPSGNARFQYGKYKKANPNIQITLPDFIKMKWMEKWHEI